MGLTSGCSGICVGEASLTMDVKDLQFRMMAAGSSQEILCELGSVVPS